MHGRKEPFLSGLTRVLTGNKSAATLVKPNIVIFGIGGAGGNAVSNMIRSKLPDASFVAADTDAQALGQSLCEERIQLGRNLTEGLGAGAQPDVGRTAAEDEIPRILEQLRGNHIAFITAGMGGGTGTGAAPVIGHLSRSEGILTVGVVTQPFDFEGPHRMKTASEGIAKLESAVDTLIVIPNQNLFRTANQKTTLVEAFKMADDVLLTGVTSLTELMVKPGHVNLDFADVRTVMSLPGKALMGVGEGSGPGRAKEAASLAVANPLLSGISLRSARGVVVNVTGGSKMTLNEIDEAVSIVRDEIDSDANLIFGSTFNDESNARLRVTIFATGIHPEAVSEDKGGSQAKPGKASRERDTKKAKGKRVAATRSGKQGNLPGTVAESSADKEDEPMPQEEQPTTGTPARRRSGQKDDRSAAETKRISDAARKAIAVEVKQVVAETKRQSVEQFKRIAEQMRRKAELEAKRAADKAQRTAVAEAKQITDGVKRSAMTQAKEIADQSKAKAEKQAETILQEARSKASAEAAQIVAEIRRQTEEEIAKLVAKATLTAETESKKIAERAKGEALTEARRNAEKTSLAAEVEVRQIIEDARREAEEDVRRIVDRRQNELLARSSARGTRVAVLSVLLAVVVGAGGWIVYDRMQHGEFPELAAMLNLKEMSGDRALDEIQRTAAQTAARIEAEKGAARQSGVGLAGIEPAARQSDPVARLKSEQTRIRAEAVLLQAETVKLRAEEERLKAETAKLRAEEERLRAEAARLAAEKAAKEQGAGAEGATAPVAPGPGSDGTATRSGQTLGMRSKIE